MAIWQMSPVLQDVRADNRSVFVYRIPRLWLEFGKLRQLTFREILSCSRECFLSLRLRERPIDRQFGPGRFETANSAPDVRVASDKTPGIDGITNGLRSHIHKRFRSVRRHHESVIDMQILAQTSIIVRLFGGLCSGIANA